MCVLLAMVVGCDKKPPIDPTPIPPEPQVDGGGSTGMGAVHATPLTQTTAHAEAKLRKVTADEFRKVISDAAAQGKVVVVDVWATWCVPCIEMFPAVHKGIEKLGDDVVLLTLSIDSETDETQVVEFLQEQHAMKNAYMMVEDEAELLKLQQVLGNQWDSLVVPAMFVYNADDKVAGEFIMAVTAEQVIASATRTLAANK
jgi:thiol-disulfide isomerase/thioredoxin